MRAISTLRQTTEDDPCQNATNTQQYRETQGEPASTVEKEDGALKVEITGGQLHIREAPGHQTFTELLYNWGAPGY